MASLSSFSSIGSFATGGGREAEGATGAGGAALGGAAGGIGVSGATGTDGTGSAAGGEGEIVTMTADDSGEGDGLLSSCAPGGRSAGFTPPGSRSPSPVCAPELGMSPGFFITAWKTIIPTTSAATAAAPTSKPVLLF